MRLTSTVVILSCLHSLGQPYPTRFRVETQAIQQSNLVHYWRICNLSGCEAGVVRAKPRDELAKKVHQIYEGVAEVIEQFRPHVMALEELYSHYQRPRTSILMGHARGVICLAAAEAGIPVFNYSATQVKKVLTGSGRAPKSQMQEAIRRELGLAQLPEPADVADALAIGLVHYYLAVKPARV